ncbi:hypothetical protein UFOVP653_72 [uncultured Caudovirales phage]|uniref:Uncharacterized protein n=1 Tax=uncultured Caudovirales phage TaxID=2100421 RepID=A0A6J5ND54_9CAUD|nr:hypothetical protein UFOVP653_72 [uncultured Caudovirales phage]
MAAFKINNFSGIRPRVPESLLPEGAATIARNCDFAYGELRNTKAGYGVNQMQNVPASIYTDDGLTFYTWTTDVNAVRSPIAKDTFHRLYYTGDGGVKVTDRIGTTLTGGPPASSYVVGVPRPTVAPALAVAITQYTSATASFAFKFHYEYGGVKYQEQDVTPTVVIDGAAYTFIPPAKLEETNEQAFPVLRMTATNTADSSQIFDVYTSNSSFDSTGGIYALSMSQDPGNDYYTATLATGVKEADKEARAYVYTYVNTYNEEGPPSAPVVVTTSPVVAVNVTVTKDAIGTYAPIKEIRIYRTPTGSTIADYFYVGSIAVLTEAGLTFVFNDNVKGEQLNEVLSSTDYYPPDPGLVGLMSLPNGILCAWKGNELHFSEAYKPWAWPPAYVKPLPNAIVGGIAHGSGAVITTVTQPYLVSGVSPDSMTTTRLNVDQAGVSKWSIAVVDGAVIYASNDGLVVLSGGTASLLQSQKFFTREVWRERYAAGLSGMRFAAWDGRLVVYSNNGAFIPFMIRVDEADGTMTDLFGFDANCGFNSPMADQFYYANGPYLYQFNGGPDQTATWQSREMVLPKPINFGFAQAVTTGTWTLEMYADGQLKHMEVLAQGTTNFRLPAGFKSDRWKIKLTGSGRFRELRVGETARDLVNV